MPDHYSDVFGAGEDRDSDGLGKGEFHTKEEVIYRIIQLLNDVEMVGLMPTEVQQELEIPVNRPYVRDILDNLVETGIADETNGFYSLTEDDARLADLNAQHLGRGSVELADWSDYDDPELEELPGIGEE